ncbi:MAG TPA: hypothetical protein VF246_04065 [Acidimicrobiia bacterium]
MIPGDRVAMTPPPSVPLSFLGAAAFGLFGFGFVSWFAADKLVTVPNHPGAVAAVHTGVLAFLTVAVLGALHQFAPVVGNRRLRSVVAGRLTMVAMVAAGWLLPNGFAHGPEWMILAGGLSGAVGVAAAAWNLSGPLSSRSGGVPVIGLRFSIAYLVVTVGFGLVYVLNRHAAWFPLLPNRVLAHAHLGLLGWLGLTYVAVAEKLWPMFLLAHRPRARSGMVAVTAVGTGTLPLALGLLFAVEWLAVAGGLVVLVGLGAHLVSLASSVRHRRRPLEMLHAYLACSTLFLLAGVAFGVAAAFADVTPATRMILVGVEVGSLLAWLALAVAGHSHKIVPFIQYTRLRSQGVERHRSGRPLLFGDLYRRGPAWLTLALLSGGFGLILAGMLAGAASLTAVGGASLGIAGIVVGLNLALGPKLAGIERESELAAAGRMM